MSPKNIFKNVDIVLVSPQIPENIGLAARVIKNTGFRNLKLVNPNLKDKSFQVAKRARGILEKAKSFTSLKDAVGDSAFVLGTTRRKRKYNSVYNFDYIKGFIIAACKDKRISLVFGREDTGLSKEEIDLCDSVFYLPADEKFSSYNLSFSVGIVCYELFNLQNNSLDFSSLDLARKKEVENMFLYCKKYLNRNFSCKYAEGAYRNLVRVLTRTHLTKNEVSLIKSLLVRALDDE